MVTKEELDQTEQQLNQVEAQARTIQQTPIPERRYGGGITPQYQQDIINRRREAQNALDQIAKSRESLQAAREQLRQQEEQRAAQQGQIANQQEAQEYNRGYELAVTNARKGKEAIGLTGAMLRGYQDYKNNLPKQTSSTSEVIPGDMPGYTIQSTAQGYVATNILTGEKIILQGTSTASSPSGVAFQGLPLSTTPSNITPGGEIQHVEAMPIEPIDFLGKLKYELSTAPFKTDNEAIKFLAGAGASYIDTAQSIRYLAEHNPVYWSVHPNKAIEDIPQIGASIYYGGQKIITEGLPEVGTLLKEQPEYSTGYALGTVSQFFIPEAIVKGVDISRTTFGFKTTSVGKIPILQKGIPGEEIIAPETLILGQNYPKVYPGETAGQLLEEFKPMPEIFPGETKPAGFTAYPNELTVPYTLPGTSQYKGMFQAPDLNPKFFKLSSETDLIGTDIFPNLKPTGFRVTPTRYEFAPGITSSSKISPELLKMQQEFILNKAEKGVAYITYTKSTGEKEAVIALNTYLEQTGKRIFIRWEGRRIPIPEYKALGPLDIPSKNAITYKELLSSYYGNTKARYVINPYSGTILSSKLASYSIKKETISSSSYNLNSKTSKVYPTFGGYSYSTPKSKISYSPPSYQSKVSYSQPSSSSFKGSSFKAPLSYSYIAPPSRGPPRPSGGGYSGLSYTYKTPNKYPIIPPPQYKNNKTQNKKNDFIEGFRTFFIRKGEKVFLPGIRSKGGALKYGSEYTKGTLRATFGIKPSKLIYGREEKFSPSSKIFRSYRIKKGRKVPLENMFIQKTRKEGGLKGGRLSFYPEIKEIQRYNK